MDTTKVSLAVLCIAFYSCGVSAQIPLNVTLTPSNGVIGNNEFTISCITTVDVSDIAVIQISKLDINGTEVVLVFFSIAAGGSGSWTNTSGDLSSRAEFDVVPTPRPYIDLTFNEVICDDEATYVCQMIGGDVGSGIRIYAGDATVDLHAKPEALTVSFAPLGPFVLGDRVNLTCAGNVGVPAGNVTWFKYTDTDGIYVQHTDDITNSVPVHNELNCMYSMSSDLVYVVAATDYALTFRCDVTNPTLSTVSTIQPLNLTVPGLSIESTPDVGVVGPGLLTVKCINTLSDVKDFTYIEISRQEPPGGALKKIAYMDSANPVWFSGNDALADRATLYGSLVTSSTYLNIELSVVECDDQTVYSCQMNAGTSTTGNTFIVGNGIIDIHAKPDNMVVTSDPDIHLLPGNSVVLFCSSDVGSPAGDITWSQWTDPRGTWIPWTGDVVTNPEIQSSACMYTRNSTLSYTTVAGEYGLKFRCEVDHSTLISRLTKEIILDVPGPTTPAPIVTTSPTDPPTTPTDPPTTPTDPPTTPTDPPTTQKVAPTTSTDPPTTPTDPPTTPTDPPTNPTDPPTTPTDPPTIPTDPPILPTDPPTEAPPPITTPGGSDVVVIATTVSLVGLVAVVGLILAYMYLTNKIGRRKVLPESTANRTGYDNRTFSDDAPVEN